MFPISDDNPRRYVTPYVNWTLIGASILVFFWQVSLGSPGGDRAVFSLGMIPARLFGYAELAPGLETVPAWGTILTSMFMHGGLLHLGGNMLYLWIFGDNIEDCLGHGRYLIFYLLCGTAAAFGQALLDPTSEIPMVGASGAISGVLGAYVLLHPRATIRVLIFIVVFVTIGHIPAILVIGFWFLGQLISAASAPASEGGIAFWAHIGGFVAGLALVPFMKRRHVPLLEPAYNRPFKIEHRRGPWG